MQLFMHWRQITNSDDAVQSESYAHVTKTYVKIENGGAGQVGLNGLYLNRVSDAATSTVDFPSVEGGFYVDWITMKWWTADEIEESWQDAVDI